MQTLKEGNIVLVVLSAGEEIIDSLLQAASAHEIAGGTLSGLGSTSEVEIAFFDPEKKEYLPRTFKEPMEIGNMVGNFSRLGDDRHVHVHVTVSGPELIAFTGHLKRGIVGTACEIYIHAMKREIRRVQDSALGFSPLELK